MVFVVGIGLKMGSKGEEDTSKAKKNINVISMRRQKTSAVYN